MFASFLTYIQIMIKINWRVYICKTEYLIGRKWKSSKLLIQAPWTEESPFHIYSKTLLNFLSQIMYYWYSSLLLQRIYKAWQFQFQLLRVCRMLCSEICKSYRPSRFIDHKLIIHSIHLSQKINLASIKTYKCKKL